MVCLDTTFAVDMLRGREQVIKLEEKIDESDEDKTITTPTIMELSKGAILGNKPQEEKDKILRFLSSLTILDLEEDSALLAGEIEAKLRKKGEFIGVEDIMIAAICIINNETLVTRNKKHFEKIPNLKIESY